MDHMIWATCPARSKWRWKINFQEDEELYLIVFNRAYMFTKTIEPVFTNWFLEFTTTLQTNHGSAHPKQKQVICTSWSESGGFESAPNRSSCGKNYCAH